MRNIYLLAFGVIISLSSPCIFADCSCRNLIFAAPFRHKRLASHQAVIAVEEIVNNDDAIFESQLRCRARVKCVAFNLESFENMKHKCWLLKTDRHQNSSDAFIDDLNSVYFELKHNPCRSDPCLHGGSCLAGFGETSCLCVCKAGFTGQTCEQDVNECSEGSHDCNKANGICNNTVGNYTCVCKPGFTGDGRNCKDIDECRHGNHKCDKENGICNNTVGNYTCVCRPGFEGDGRNCKDIDECRHGNHKCDKQNGTCTNTVGNYTCACKPGFEGDGRNCKDMDECRDGNHKCDKENGICNNTVGNYTCACKPGFTGDGRNCKDIDECRHGNHKCDKQNGTCTNTVGNYTCACKPGFEGDGRNCKDMDECRHGNHRCDKENGTCTNTVGNYTCACKPGFTGNGRNCTVIPPPCDLNPCQNGGKCTNEVYNAGFTCTCINGYAGDMCEITPPCISNPCQNNGTCVNHDNNAGYTCNCNNRFTGARCRHPCILHFASKSTSNSVIIPNAFASKMSKFTVSFWLKAAPDTKVDLVPFSYTKNSINDLVVTLDTQNYLKIKYGGLTRSFESLLARDSKWYYHCITYDSLQDDGTLIYYRTGFSTTVEAQGVTSVPRGGTFVIGQLQGSIGGEFQDDKYMYDYITNLNIWSTAKSVTGCRAIMSAGCATSSKQGDMLSWNTIMSRSHNGNLHPMCDMISECN